jgi:hypothetical protein
VSPGTWQDFLPRKSPRPTVWGVTTDDTAMGRRPPKLRLGAKATPDLQCENFLYGIKINNHYLQI